MLKIIFSLVNDWIAYRRAMSGRPQPGGATPSKASRCRFAEVSIWPVERHDALDYLPFRWDGCGGSIYPHGLVASGIESVDAK